MFHFWCLLMFIVLFQCFHGIYVYLSLDTLLRKAKQVLGHLRRISKRNSIVIGKALHKKYSPRKYNENDFLFLQKLF